MRGKPILVSSGPSDRDQHLRTLELSMKTMQEKLLDFAAKKNDQSAENGSSSSSSKNIQEARDRTSAAAIPLPGSLPGYCIGTESLRDDSISQVGKIIREGALRGFLIWVAGLVLVFRFAPIESYQGPHGTERNAHLITFALLLVTNGSRILPLAVRDGNLNFMKSGVLVGTVSVQCIAMVSNIVLSFVPTPVLVDEISGLRVHLIRWVEWITLTFLMTFLTDNIDAPLRPDSSKPKYGLAICLALSTAGGVIFPFCPNLASWLVVFAHSWVLFCALFVKLYSDAMRYRARTRASIDISADAKESSELIRSSFILTSACCATWTMLALSFSLVCLAPTYAPGTIFAHPAFPAVCTCFFEVASKIWYLSALIEIYDNVFDESTRVARRLEELRHFMSAIWESSSDVIVFCTQSDGRVNARISPAFLKMVGLSTGHLPFLDRGDVSLVLEIFPEKDSFYVFAIDLAKPVTRQFATALRESSKAEERSLTCSGAMTTEDKNLVCMAHLAIKACSLEGSKGTEHSSMEDLLVRGECGTEGTVRCEARFAKLDSTSSVIVFRDISDRIQRFEVEKELVKEVTIRKQDIEANRFTRHEVKNGILAAIGLVDHLRELTLRPVAEESNGQLVTEVEPKEAIEGTSLLRCLSDATLSSSGGLPDDIVDIKGSFDELESTLSDILDTILDKAMAREIVYGEYEPKKEQMDVPAVLASLRRRTSRRFPLTVSPNPFPRLAIDRQLLRVIYRNAISNACKYGSVGGLVETLVHYDRKERAFTMEVMNLPGAGHEGLQKLGEAAIALMFSPGTQLLETQSIDSVEAEMIRNDSSGNGAWIMLKCAEAMGGKCAIRFEFNRTVFSFECPIEAGDLVWEVDSSDEEEFHLPEEEIQGIIIDDSMIQRKLLDRFLGVAGISKSRRHILGKNSNEVFGFTDFVIDMMKKHPDDKFLVIADENLDIVDGGARHETISGSKCVEELRGRLDESEERRLLALIRSANDSTKDLETYRSRAHGFLLKEPLKNARVLDTIKPWWIARFPSKMKRRISYHSPESMESADLSGPSVIDIENELKMINALCVADDNSTLRIRWPAIREKMHALKGDIKTMKSKESLANVDEQIDNLARNSHLPKNFANRWSEIRSQIESIL